MIVVKRKPEVCSASWAVFYTLFYMFKLKTPVNEAVMFLARGLWDPDESILFELNRHRHPHFAAYTISNLLTLYCWIGLF